MDLEGLRSESGQVQVVKSGFHCSCTTGSHSKILSILPQVRVLEREDVSFIHLSLDADRAAKHRPDCARFALVWAPLHCVFPGHAKLDSQCFSPRV
jgi:hypothetical protein